MSAARFLRMSAIAWLAIVCATLLAPAGVALAATKTTHAPASAAATHTVTATPTATAASSAAATPTVTPAGTGPLAPGVTPLAPTPTTNSTTPTILSTTTSGSGSSSLSGGSAIGIAVGAFVVLGGIAFFIWRDARRRAPVAARRHGSDDTDDGRNRPGSKAPPKARKLSAAERKRRKRGRAKSTRTKR